jgi:2,6-dihydroxypseudooxynicotine hydrolase
MTTASKIAAILNPGRMMADGIPYPDYAEAVRRLDEGDDWFDVWMETGRRYEVLGREALAEGARVSAGAWLWHASLSAHYAQFMWFHDPERREAGQRAKAALYRDAAPYLVPAAERLDLPFEDVRIPCYLRRPAARDSEPAPCVVLIGGLESTKEESRLFEDMCLHRGMATLAFDGPGQGEMFFDRKLGPDFDRVTSAVIGHLGRVDDIDSARIGVLGRSLGGHYALRSAACDARLRACVAWGACFDLEDLDEMPAHTRDGFLYVTGIDDPEEGREHLRWSIDLSDVAPELNCPTYVLHGARDHIFTMDQVAKLRERLTAAALEIVVEPDGDHCCHNMGPVVRPRMADWLARRLDARPPEA